jgi:hypothetical protein
VKSKTNNHNSAVIGIVVIICFGFSKILYSQSHTCTSNILYIRKRIKAGNHDGLLRKLG